MGTMKESLESFSCMSHYISRNKLSQQCECVVCTHMRAQAHKNIQIKPTQNRQPLVWRQAWPLIAESSSQPHQCCCFYLCAIHLGSFLLLLPRRLPFFFFLEVYKTWPSLAAAFPQPCTTWKAPGRSHSVSLNPNHHLQKKAAEPLCATFKKTRLRLSSHQDCLGYILLKTPMYQGVSSAWQKGTITSRPSSQKMRYQVKKEKLTQEFP